MNKEREQEIEFLKKLKALEEAGRIDELLAMAGSAGPEHAEAVSSQKPAEEAVRLEEPAEPPEKENDGYVTFENVRKVYHVGEVDIEALADATFCVNKGELAVVVGESGAGKTTLLNILGGMDTLTSGRVILDGREISKMNQKELTKYRRYDIGFVFQFYNLVQNLTALENVSLATQICKDPLDPAETLKAVGLEDRMNNFPGQLSGGEQQRVAIARALAKNPKLLLCDEPTGALDYNTGKSILQLLQDQARSAGTTVIIITHNKAITPMADRIISVRSGRVQSVKINTDPVPVSEIEW